MEGEVNISDQYLKTKTSSGDLSVLVVDDDIICLSIVAGILKTMKYEVVTVKNAEDALMTLGQRSYFFNLVVTDVHMPDMDGFEFQKKVREIFHLPVVMMSADDKESSILRGLEAGAAFYIVKPVNYDDLKNLWQFAISSRRAQPAGVSVGVGGNRKNKGSRGAPVAQKTSSVDRVDMDYYSVAVPSKDQKKNKSRDRKNKNPIDEDNIGKEKTETAAPKKTKIVWTNALHDRFLEALRKIGLHRAVPKRILETMDIPGLTRENVASHLQKYRIFLKRLTEASNSIMDGSCYGRNSLERTLRSSFAVGNPSLVIRALQMANNTPSLSSASSSTDFIPQVDQYGQLHSLMNNQDYFQQNTTPARNPKAPYLAGDCNGDDASGLPPNRIQGRSQLLSDTKNFDGTEISNGFSTHGLGDGDNGNMINLTGQFSPRFPDDIQQEHYYSPMIGNNASVPKFSGNGLDEIFLEHPNGSLSFNEQQEFGEGAHNHFATREWDGSINSYHFGNGGIFDNYPLSLGTPPPNQQQGGGEFLDINGYSKVNQAWNQSGRDDDIMGSIFGPGAY